MRTKSPFLQGQQHRHSRARNESFGFHCCSDVQVRIHSQSLDDLEIYAVRDKCPGISSCFNPVK